MLRTNTIKIFLTPGLADADPTLRREAANTICTGLRQGGEYKILFFVRVKNRRIYPHDIATMRVILEAVSDIKKNYAIIINMAKKDSLENADEVIKMLFSEIPEEKQCPRSRVILLGIVEELDEEDNVLVSTDNFKSEAGVKLPDFLDKVPIVNIRSENVNDINIEGL